jgi:hypothetical protein
MAVTSTDPYQRKQNERSPYLKLYHFLQGIQSVSDATKKIRVHCCSADAFTYLSPRRPERTTDWTKRTRRAELRVSLSNTYHYLTKSSRQEIPGYLRDHHSDLGTHPRE